MNLNQIRYFLSLAETLNFTEAARRNDVTQPALTRAVRKLEEELGGALVHRDGKDTRLTALGRAIRDEFAAIVAAEARVRASVSEHRHGARATLNVGLGHSLAPAPISRFLTRLLREAPTLELLLHPIDGENGAALVLSGALDGAFVADPPGDHPKLAVDALFEERLMLACPRRHPLADYDVAPLSELADEDYLDRLGCEFRERAETHLMRRDVVMRPRFRTHREDWIQQAVADGAGVCLLPEHWAIVPGLALRPVEGLDLSRRVAFVSVFASTVEPALRDLRALLRRHAWPRPQSSTSTSTSLSSPTS